MANPHIVCSMCGDIGFADKLFHCIRCHSRFQHSYCTNYYDEATYHAGVCDWCISKEQTGTAAKRAGIQSKKLITVSTPRDDPCQDGESGDRVQSSVSEDSRGRAKSGSSSIASSTTKHTGRRYKLLKDVLC